MPDTVILLSIPGLRQQDLAHLPRLQKHVAGGDLAPLVASFPAVTCPVQVNMTTGKLPREHGVIANGFYWREKQNVEMWTAWNDVIVAPQIWDILSQHDSSIISAVWFPLLSKGCEANLICTPAPIHNPDGSESLWCYTRPTEYYGELRDQLGHFPLMNFWGPMANIKSTDWIAKSAVQAANKWQPHFFYIYLPHLDYAAQKYGPNSSQALTALTELDAVLDELFNGMQAAYAKVDTAEERHPPLFIVASEYGITPVNHVVYPNRVLREAGLLVTHQTDQGTEIDFANSRAWALVDHQFAHVFVKNSDETIAKQVQQLFAGQPGIDQVLLFDQRSQYDLDHARAGEVVLVSTPESWQAYYWWTEPAEAPKYARTVDIHRKPGYDPVELFIDMPTKSIPLDATLVKGSHGAPARTEAQRGVILTNQPGVLEGPPMTDTDVFEIVLRQFGI